MGLKGHAVSVVVVVLVAIAISAMLSRHHWSGPSGPAIYVEGARLVVENQTGQPWHDVTVTVNSYYRGISPTLEAGGRLEAPLASFVSSFGYRFNTAREHVMTVEVRALDPGGKSVGMNWDEKGGRVEMLDENQGRQ